MSRYVLAAAALLAGCGPSTSLQNVWSAPDASTVSFDKVIVVGVSSQPSMRRSMEDHMVRVLTRVQATQSYLLLSDDEYNNHEAAKIKNTDIVNELKLPPVKIHCSVLAEDAIKAALQDYREKWIKDEAPSGGDAS